MATHIKTKRSFGSVTVDHFSPPKESEWPKAINVHIDFEEALKLHLGLGQILGHLNSYNRATTKGRQAAVNLCLYPQASRITINEGKVRVKERM